MRKTKEEKVIDKSHKALEELAKNYNDGLVVTDFQFLLDEYKKLNKRYIKTIKLSDKMGHGIIKENSKLNDNLEYTVKTARNKILENISEHRKTKEKSSLFENQLKKYESQIKILTQKNLELEKKVKLYEKEYLTVKKSFKDIVDSSDSNEIKSFEALISEKDFNKKIQKELDEKETFYLCKIALKNFPQMIKDIEKVTSLGSFTGTIGKYLKNNLTKDDLVIHHSLEVFYLLIKKDEESKVINIMSNLNKKRVILDLPIEFTIGFTKCNDNKIEEYNTVISRCKNAFISATENNKIVLR